MELIKRELFDKLQGGASAYAQVILGSRRVGKTTLLREIAGEAEALGAWYSGDNPEDIDRLNLYSSADVKTLLQRSDTLVIDEAQRFPDIGLTIKRLADANEWREKPVRILVTGSSSLDLSRGVQESAVGRFRNFQMWPLSVTELATDKGWGAVESDLSRLVVYGMYPNPCTEPEQARRILRDYVDGILFKDIFSLAGIRRNSQFEHLVRALAYCVGLEVNFDSLSRETGLNRMTVASYIRLLEQCYIVRVCGSYARNLSNELKKGKKVYFCDNGIRNAILNDFSPLSARADAGALWENFFYMERVKKHTVSEDFTDIYFWRTAGRKPREIDFLEVRDGKILDAFECKLSPEAHSAGTASFLEAYPGTPVTVATPKNLMSIWLTERKH